MKIKLLIGTITIIMTAISILLFRVAGIIGAAYPALSALCIVSGILLIIPLALFALLSAANCIRLRRKR